MDKLCVFDLDGTLVNTINDIADAVNASLVSLGCPPHPDAAYTQMVGDGMHMLCVRALPEDKKALVDELERRYAARYIENCCVRSAPYPGIPELLHRLGAAGIPCAIASNKPDAQTRRVLRHYFPDIAFAAAYGQRPELPRKPAPDLLARVMRECGATPGRTIYVGDSNVDVQFAHAAGVRCAGAAWGFRGAQELRAAGADWVVSHPDELDALIRG